MNIIFCEHCGAENTSPTEICKECNKLSLMTEITSRYLWEEVKVKVVKKTKVEEQKRLPLLQKVKSRPLASSVCASGVAIFLCALIWLFFYLGGPPKCLEYREFGCSFITLNRPTIDSASESEIFPDVKAKSDKRVSAEILDLMRLVVISRDSQNIVTIYSVLNNSARNDNWSSNCFDVESCRSKGTKGDIDFEGLTGSLGLNFDGSLQTTEFASPSLASPIWNFRSKGGKKASVISDREFLVEEIHLVSNDQAALKTLHPVASQFRKELQKAGIKLRVLVTLESYSRRSKKNAVRIVLKRFQDPLRPFNKTVSLTFGMPSDPNTWSVNLDFSRDQILAALSDGVEVGSSIVLFADCIFNPIEEGRFLMHDSKSIDVMCVGSSRYRDLIKKFQSEKVVDQIFVIGGVRESKVVKRLNLDIPKGPGPIFILRL